MVNNVQNKQLVYKKLDYDVEKCTVWCLKILIKMNKKKYKNNNFRKNFC